MKQQINEPPFVKLYLVAAKPSSNFIWQMHFCGELQATLVTADPNAS